MGRHADKSRTALLEAEIGTIRKRWQNRTRVALIFPNHYPVGMANLGFQTVYRLLNSMDHVVCERVFLPKTDTVPVTLESGRSLHDFDCLAFSLTYENDYLHVLTILQKTGLPLPAAHRGASLPLIMAGGVACFLNPEPIALFFDCILIGEAEAVLPKFFQYHDPHQDRRQMLIKIAQVLPGVYVPQFYNPQYHQNGALKAFEPKADVPTKIKRVHVAHIDQFTTDSTIITPHTVFDDAHLIEVSRGCPHGCRFCSAGYVYRPPRFRSVSQIQQSMQKGVQRTGKIGLMGAAVSDLPGLKSLCAYGQKQNLQLSFSSLRADALTPDLIAAMQSSRLKTATIAPETGSERLRRVINKGIREEDILTAAEKLVASGIANIKLYFMIGLPTETEADVAAIVTLVKKIKHYFLQSSRVRGHMGDITVSLNSFIPKPFTPFQWAAMDEVKLLKQKIKKIKQGLKKTANVRVHADVPRWAFIQALLSHGDRRTAQLLLQAHENNGNWPQTLKTSPLNASFYVHRERHQEELLPWDFIDHGVSKAFLWNEYQRALAEETSPPCPMEYEKCRVCGVCGVSE